MALLLVNMIFVLVKLVLERRCPAVPEARSGRQSFRARALLVSVLSREVSAQAPSQMHIHDALQVAKNGDCIHIEHPNQNRKLLLILHLSAWRGSCSQVGIRSPDYSDVGSLEHGYID